MSTIVRRNLLVTVGSTFIYLSFCGAAVYAIFDTTETITAAGYWAIVTLVLLLLFIPIVLIVWNWNSIMDESDKPSRRY